MESKILIPLLFLRKNKTISIHVQEIKTIEINLYRDLRELPKSSPRLLCSHQLFFFPCEDYDLFTQNLVHFRNRNRIRSIFYAIHLHIRTKTKQNKKRPKFCTITLTTYQTCQIPIPRTFFLLYLPYCNPSESLFLPRWFPSREEYTKVGKV